MTVKDVKFGSIFPHMGLEEIIQILQPYCPAVQKTQKKKKLESYIE